MADPAPLPRIVTDRTGARLVLRPIRPEDWRELQEGFASWTPEQRRLRLLDTRADLPEALARRLATVDPAHEICLVLAPEADPSDLLAGARLVGAPGRDDGEFAVSVRADAQGRGLGALALAAVLAEGPRLGIARAFGLIGRRNAPMLALARRLGFALRPEPEDVTVLVAERTL